MSVEWGRCYHVIQSYRNLHFLPLSCLIVRGRVGRRRCLGEGPMTRWLWQPGRGTMWLYNTPTPQIGTDRCMQNPLPVGTSSNRSLPSTGMGLKESVLATIRPTMMISSTRCSDVVIRTQWATSNTDVSIVVKANIAFP